MYDGSTFIDMASLAGVLFVSPPRSVLALSLPWLSLRQWPPEVRATAMPWRDVF